MYDLYGNKIVNAEIAPDKIILLDLNYTLISNSPKCYGAYPKRIYQQKYEKQLINMIKDNYVILITARPIDYKDETLAHIKKLTGFVPDESYWNFSKDESIKPPALKEHWLVKDIFKNHGDCSDLYYAIESNAQTRRMYSKYNIKADRKQDIMAKYK